MVHPAFATQQRARWMRPDAARWLRPDAAKFLKPGTNPADIYPALARVREAQAHELDATLARERAALDGLRAELAAVKSDLAWRRFVDAVAQKYSPNQPRVPAGQTGGGQWTSGSGGGSGGVYFRRSGGENEVDVAPVYGDEQAYDIDAGFDDRADRNPGFDEGRERDLDDQSVPAFDNTPARDRSPRTTDTRVISDADPEVVKPGQRYATARGHHKMPQALFNKWDLSPETRRVFDAETTGRLPGRTTVRTSPDGVPLWHTWNKAHRDYNKAVEELSDSFMSRYDVTPSEMNPSQARQLLDEIRGSQDPRIRDYNRAMQMLRRIFRLRLGRSE